MPIFFVNGKYKLVERPQVHLLGPPATADADGWDIIGVGVKEGGGGVGACTKMCAVKTK